MRRVVRFLVLAAVLLLFSSSCSDIKYDFQIRMGDRCYNKGEFDKAVYRYTKAIEHRPSYEWTYMKRAAVYYRMGDRDLAVMDFRKAAQLNPYDFAPEFCIGVIHAEDGNTAEALQAYNAAISIDPWGYEAYNNRGNIHQDNGDLDLAMADYNKAIENYSYYPMVYYNRGCLYMKRGEPAAALADFDSVLDQFINYYYDEYIYTPTGLYNAAIVDYAYFRETLPPMNFLYYQKALALEMLGRNDQVPDNLMLYIRMAEPGEPFYADAASRIKSIGK